MLRLIRLGLKRQGLPVPSFAAPKSAHIPLSDKRSLIHHLLGEHGATTLLKLGEAVKDAPDEPMVTALMFATDPFDLITRWQRLEKFVHSKHRTRIVSHTGAELVLQHYAHRGSIAPWPEEDFLVFGLLIALIEKNGAQDVRARVHGTSRWHREKQHWRDLPMRDDVSTWQIQWQSQHHKPPPEADCGPISDWLETARHRMEQDPGRSWTLDLLANDLNTSRRTLQRRLRQENSGFTSLLLEVRSAAAAQLLGKTTQSPAEIGYACGFSDQAHFTREFKRFTAITPLVFREQFTTQS